MQHPSQFVFLWLGRTTSGSSSSTSSNFPSFFNCFFFSFTYWETRMAGKNVFQNLAEQCGVDKCSKGKGGRIERSPYAPHIPFLHGSHLRLSSSALVPGGVYMPCPQLEHSEIFGWNQTCAWLKKLNVVMYSAEFTSCCLVCGVMKDVHTSV